MSSVTFNVNGVILNEIEFENRLNAIAGTQYTGQYVLRNDLTRMHPVTKFFWSLFGCFCPCFQHSLFKSDPKLNRRFFYSLRDDDPRFLARPSLLLAYQNARRQFHILYPLRPYVAPPSNQLQFSGSQFASARPQNYIPRQTTHHAPAVSARNHFVQAPSALPVRHAPARHVPVLSRPPVFSRPTMPSYRPSAPARSNFTHVMPGSRRR